MQLQQENNMKKHLRVLIIAAVGLGVMSPAFAMDCYSAREGGVNAPGLPPQIIGRDCNKGSIKRILQIQDVVKNGQKVGERQDLYEYNKAGLLVRHADSNPYTSGSEFIYEWEGNNLVSIASSVGVNTREYDNLGRLTLNSFKQRNPSPFIQDGTDSYQYETDENGVTKVVRILGDGGRILTSFDRKGREIYSKILNYPARDYRYSESQAGPVVETYQDGKLDELHVYSKKTGLIIRHEKAPGPFDKEGWIRIEYEYKFDKRGNWILKQQIKLTSNDDRAPDGLPITRKIEYWK